MTKKEIANISLEKAIVIVKNHGMIIKMDTQDSDIKAFARLCLRRQKKAINHSKHYHGK